MVPTHRLVAQAKQRRGWMVLLLALAFCANVFRAIDRHSHSVSDTLHGVFAYFACAFVLYEWVASRSSRD